MYVCLFDLFFCNLLVIGSAAIFVTSTVDQPGRVEQEAPTQHNTNVPGVGQSFIEKVHGSNGWQDETGNGHQEVIVSVKRKKMQSIK